MLVCNFSLPGEERPAYVQTGLNTRPLITITSGVGACRRLFLIGSVNFAEYVTNDPHKY